MSTITATLTTPRESTAAGHAVELREVTLRAGGRLLLDGASARFEPGEVTLIIGSSGVGKSVLLRVLAGLVTRRDETVSIEGAAEIGGKSAIGRAGKNGAGVVFQHFALLDELSAVDNVRLAHAHAGRRAGDGQNDARPGQLLDELEVPCGVPTASLSGGQRQRLAIARTLAQRPDVVLYDEPTSGLDAATAERVASLIARTHESHPTTSIIVTHDYESLISIADRVYLFDGETHSLREIERQHWHELRRFLRPAPRGDEPASVPWWRRPLAWGSTLAGRIGGFFVETSRADEETLLAPLRLLPLWRNPAWGLRFLVHYLRLVAGPSAWVYIAVAGLISGFVATYFTFRFLPYEQYIKQLVIEDLLTSIGFALYRIIVPLLAMILIAARCGAAVASDVGGKAYGRQLDALRTLGVAPQRYLLTPILYAFLIGSPLLTALGYAVAALTSLVVFTVTHPDRGVDFWQHHFHAALTVPGQWLYDGSGWLLAKTLVCALGVGLISYHQGTGQKLSNRDVSHGITRTILWSTLLVLVVHFVFAFFEFE
jgi:ABC-type transporter Mla maintaining outer membrane lipid asymmetry ATPase subunit MlaF/ABC-type transporter Mla maintaining outer membrane lipid asymmetry permease subunit MlaE